MIHVDQVWVVDYIRRDGCAVSPIVCQSQDYAAEVTRILIDARCADVESVKITRRPTIPGEL